MKKLIFGITLMLCGAIGFAGIMVASTGLSDYGTVIQSLLRHGAFPALIPASVFAAGLIVALFGIYEKDDTDK